jgi:hypothetical protein
MVPSLAVLRQDQLRPIPTSGDGGVLDPDELAEDVLLKRRWVDSWTLEWRASHHGQDSVRVSQPSSLSFSGQLARLFWTMRSQRASTGLAAVADTYCRMAGFGKLVPTVSAVLRRDEQSHDAHGSSFEA